jgi:hypothetical protein
MMNGGASIKVKTAPVAATRGWAAFDFQRAHRMPTVICIYLVLDVGRKPIVGSFLPRVPMAAVLTALV